MKGLSTTLLIVSVVVLAYMAYWVTEMWLNFITSTVYDSASNLFM